MSGTVENLYNNWEEFCKLVTSEWRYTFFLDKDLDGNSVSDVLADIVRFIKDEPELTPVLSARTPIFRGRTFTYLDDKACTVEALGAPRKEHVRFPNRFNPIGIPVFYGALEKETAKEEVAGDKPYLVIGEFYNTQPIKVIDLRTAQALSRALLKLSKSLTDETKNELLFLDSLAYSLTQPVHNELLLDYIPMQIFAEYVRRVGKNELGVLGIKYPSTHNRKGTNLVLFYGADDCKSIAKEADDCLVLNETYVYKRDVPYTWINLE